MSTTDRIAVDGAQPLAITPHDRDVLRRELDWYAAAIDDLALVARQGAGIVTCAGARTLRCRCWTTSAGSTKDPRDAFYVRCRHPRSFTGCATRWRRRDEPLRVRVVHVQRQVLLRQAGWPVRLGPHPVERGLALDPVADDGAIAGGDLVQQLRDHRARGVAVDVHSQLVPEDAGEIGAASSQ